MIMTIILLWLLARLLGGGMFFRPWGMWGWGGMWRRPPMGGPRMWGPGPGMGGWGRWGRW